MYQEKPVTELLAEIAACGGLGYELDESLAAATVTGWLPLGSPRQALQQLAFAIGAVAAQRLCQRRKPAVSKKGGPRPVANLVFSCLCRNRSGKGGKRAK